jgi:hypothetical protein
VFVLALPALQRMATCSVNCIACADLTGSISISRCGMSCCLALWIPCCCCKAVLMQSAILQTVSCCGLLSEEVSSLLAAQFACMLLHAHLSSSSGCGMFRLLCCAVQPGGTPCNFGSYASVLNAPHLMPQLHVCLCTGWASPSEQHS